MRAAPLLLLALASLAEARPARVSSAYTSLELDRCQRLERGEGTARLEKDGVVLLAPACASFDMFRDYAERGQVFKKEVLKLVEEHNLRER